MREAGQRTGDDTSLSEILEFSALAFAFTWTPHFLLVCARRPYSVGARLPAAIYGVGLLGPTVAAFHVERRRYGGSGQRALLGSASPRNMSPTRVTVALAAEPIMMVFSSYLAREHIRLKAFDPAVVIGQLWVVAGEEFGWRGFVLPRLVRRCSAPMAIGIVTGLWGVWHLPMFFVKDSPQATDTPGHFAAAIFFWSALHHLLQMGRPSVGTAMLFHAAANVGSNVFATTARSRRWQTILYFGAGLAAAAVATAREVRGKRSRLPEDLK